MLLVRKEDTVLNKKVLERKHLHKIIEKETWIFGDEFVLGASDVNLKNVLKSHLAAIGRDDFESIVVNGDNHELHDIPDVCLWKQYNNGKNGYFRNLVVELKRPSVNAGIDEYNQIMNYANKVSADLRFEKDNDNFKAQRFCNLSRYYGWITMETSNDLEYLAEKFCYHIDKESLLEFWIEGEEDW